MSKRIYALRLIDAIVMTTESEEEAMNAFNNYQDNEIELLIIKKYENYGAIYFDDIKYEYDKNEKKFIEYEPYCYALLDEKRRIILTCNYLPDESCRKQYIKILKHLAAVYNKSKLPVPLYENFPNY